MASALNHSQSDKEGVSYLSDKELLKRWKWEGFLGQAR